MLFLHLKGAKKYIFCIVLFSHVLAVVILSKSLGVGMNSTSRVLPPNNSAATLNSRDGLSYSVMNFSFIDEDHSKTNNDISLATKDIARDINTNPFISYQNSIYLSTDQVDTRAAPKDKWLIQQDSVPAGAISLHFTVWISATGQIDHVEVIPNSPDSHWEYAALSKLQLTEMEPATLQDVPVPSTMSVELFVE